ncbi:DUF2809 domain-containing protein [candidate division KSB1 bacterium]|nr:DUF2809 domain-containing protein [candidate division KSB1 bacterium]
MKHFILTCISILIIVPVGFYSKFYNGPAQDWVNNSLGGVFYEIFWCLVLYLVAPKLQPRLNALIIFLVTCVLEIMQLWHPLFLETIRATFIGATVLGSSFTWTDFPYYIIGSLLGWLWLHQLIRTVYHTDATVSHD